MSKKTVTIDFLFLDLDQCTRCAGTESRLETALEEIVEELLSQDRRVVLNKVHVVTEELARQHRFLSSPTIRVNGHDIQMEVHENNCTECGDLCGDTVDCRTWVYDGVEYDVPPKELLIEGIMKALDRDEEEMTGEDLSYELPPNLEAFFKGLKEKK